MLNNSIPDSSDSITCCTFFWYFKQASYDHSLIFKYFCLDGVFDTRFKDDHESQQAEREC